MTLAKSLSKPRTNNLITAIAIDRDKNSQYAVKWAVDNLVNNENSECILLHVRSRESNAGKYFSMSVITIMVDDLKDI